VSLEAWITEAATEVQRLVDAEFAHVGTPEPGSAFDQGGLRDGLAIIRDYLEHNEAGIAFDHLLYMVTELDLVVSRAAYERIAKAGVAMMISPRTWSTVRSTP
jgi:hypothetical protein